MASGAKGSLTLLMIVAGLVIAVGGWNYQRNTTAEDRVVRPFKGLSDTELAQLTAAYDVEIETLDDTYNRASAQRPKLRGAAYADEKLREFERIQKIGQATRDLGGRVMELRAEQRLIQREIQLRSGQGSRLQEILRRAFSF